MKSFKADYVFPVCADPIKNGIVTVDDAGKIVAIASQSSPPADVPLEQSSGIICPGFINTHCHLELSHLKDKVKQHTGLVNFIMDVQKLRGADTGLVADAARAAENEMIENGIVAVGDISNTNITIPIKTAGKLHYHSFIEMFAFLPSQAEETFQKAVDLLREFKPLSSSLTPHAPYSVSKELFKLIKNIRMPGKISSASTTRNARTKINFTGTSRAALSICTNHLASISGILNRWREIPYNPSFRC